MMDTKTYTTIDRAALGWPSGPWDSEPDKVQWPDEATGFPCLAKRHPTSGHWCGYVGVPPSHPMFGKDYADVNLDGHGGVNYSDACEKRPEAEGICHVPAEDEPDHAWWFGFDCAHAWDASPADFQRAREDSNPIWKVCHDQNYKTLAYVRGECQALAAQLKAAA